MWSGPPPSALAPPPSAPPPLRPEPRLQTGYSPLHAASREGKIEVVKELVEAKADLNLQDEVSDYWSPASQAVS